MTISVNNKHIALVGLSGHLEGKGWGHLIDAADVVVRVNADTPITLKMRDDLGSRTDILFTSYNSDIRKGLLNDSSKVPGKIVLAYPNIAPFIENNQAFFRDFGDQLSADVAEEKDYIALQLLLDGRPSSGLMAIQYLINKRVLSLSLYGFSFFNSAHYKGLRKWRSNVQLLRAMAVYGTHQPQKELEYVKHLSSSDLRLRVDPFIQEMLSGDEEIKLPGIKYKWLEKLLLWFSQ